MFIIHHRRSLIYRDAAVLMSSLPPQTITRRRCEKSSKIVITHQQYEATCKKQISLAQIFSKAKNFDKILFNDLHFFGSKISKRIEHLSILESPQFFSLVPLCLFEDSCTTFFQCIFCPKVVSSNDFRSKGCYTPYLTTRVSLIKQIIYHAQLSTYEKSHQLFSLV